MVSKGFLLFSCVLATVTGFALASPEWKAGRMDEQEHPEKLKEIATTVAGVILKQKMSDTNPLGRQCKLQFVAVENFKNLADVQLENHHIFDATFKWTQCGTMNGHISTCKNFRFVQSLDMEYTPIHEDEFFCNL